MKERKWSRREGRCRASEVIESLEEMERGTESKIRRCQRKKMKL